MVSEETVPRKKKVNNKEVSQKIKNSDQRTLRDWYSIMLYPEMKAYLLFLRYILNIFSTFSAFFQSSKTRVYLLQPSSRKLLIQILRYVSKLALLNHIDEIKNIKFEEPNLLEKINLGENCNAISRSLLDGPEDLKSLEKQIESFVFAIHFTKLHHKKFKSTCHTTMNCSKKLLILTLQRFARKETIA